MARYAYGDRSRARPITRRWVLGTAALGGAAFVAACGGSDKKSDSGGSTQGTSATSTSGGQGQASGQVFLDAKSKPVTGKEKVEELRERFHPRNLKQLAGWKGQPKYGGTLRYSSNLPASWDLAAPSRRCWQAGPSSTTA